MVLVTRSGSTARRQEGPGSRGTPVTAAGPRLHRHLPARCRRHAARRVYTDHDTENSDDTADASESDQVHRARAVRGTATEFIELDPWGYPIVPNEPVPDDLIGLARKAAAACPTLALLIDKDQAA